MFKIDIGGISGHEEVDESVPIRKDGKLFARMNYLIKSNSLSGEPGHEETHIRIIPAYPNEMGEIEIENGQLVKGDPADYMKLMRKADGTEFFSKRPTIGRILSDLVKMYGERV
ncbi:MAG: hypothetical protein GTN38_02595 [Candidatus Aenigmarchaeota archaeon]|nr:hypothetical protein [Candidatus Aenigmarchaeota archaeon]NIP40525.1 hypothetical protein [Candidatus Aenigmarchaeota archaeon]NIQ18370.1 hypothetical protein [Candidatus Aenigmarchaeota archaeon]